MTFSTVSITLDYLFPNNFGAVGISGSGMTVPQWDFVGSTMVTNSHIRLTSDHQSKQGAIWNNVVRHRSGYQINITWAGL